MKKKHRIPAATAGILLAAAFSASIALPCIAAADEAPVAAEKDETVYVYTNADGNVRNVEVSTLLKNPDGASKLVDSTTLADVHGKDDATFTGAGDSLVWNADGENVSYTGTTAAAAPVSLRVSYTLDGQPVSAEELAGKSGRVTIQYDFFNNSTYQATVNGMYQTMYTPFTCITAIMFDGNNFKNVTVENGKVINDGDDMIVAGYAMPGLKQSLGSMADDADIPERFTVTADVTRFELKSTMTIVTAGLMSDLDASSFQMSGINDASALTDAMNQLISGSDKLTTGLDTLTLSIRDLQSGTASLYDGAETLSGKIGMLASSEGLPALAGGVSALEGGIGTIRDAVASVKTELMPAIETLKASVVPTAEFETAIGTLAAKHDKIVTEEGLTEAEYASVVAALTDAATMSGTVSAIAAGFSDGVAKIDELVAKIDAAKASAAALSASAADAASGAGALYEGAKSLEEGAARLSAAMPSLAEGAQAALDGSRTLTEGMRTFNDQGVSQLVNTLQSNYGGMLDRMNALSDAAKSYTNFAGITPGTAGSVKFIFETDAINRE